MSAVQHLHVPATTCARNVRVDLAAPGPVILPSGALAGEDSDAVSGIGLVALASACFQQCSELGTQFRRCQWPLCQAGKKHVEVHCGRQPYRAENTPCHYQGCIGVTNLRLSPDGGPA